MNKIDFSDDSVFLELEDRAIDGVLDYEDFPPEEYKYFSKLAKLGYLNRHKGWSAEICEEKQKELRAAYSEDKERSEKYLREMRRQNDLRIRHAQAITAICKADDLYGVLDCALTALEAALDEPGFKARIDKRIDLIHDEMALREMKGEAE